MGINGSGDGSGCLSTIGLVTVLAIIGYLIFGGSVSLGKVALIVVLIGAGVVILGVALLLLFLKLNEKDTAATQMVNKANADNNIKLTLSVDKRKQIIVYFNEKYCLNLNDGDIKTILDASYTNKNWTAQVMDMDREYSSISQWYSTDDSGVKVYLLVFPVQNVSSDYEIQKKIVLDSFNDIFSKTDMKRYSCIQECISSINEKYMTSFDDASFMFVYRLLEKKGFKYELPSATINYTNGTSEIDELMKKYDN